MTKLAQLLLLLFFLKKATIFHSMSAHRNGYTWRISAYTESASRDDKQSQWVTDLGLSDTRTQRERERESKCLGFWRGEQLLRLHRIHGLLTQFRDGNSASESFPTASTGAPSPSLATRRPWTPSSPTSIPTSLRCASVLACVRACLCTCVCVCYNWAIVFVEGSEWRRSRGCEEE